MSAVLTVLVTVLLAAGPAAASPQQLTILQDDALLLHGAQTEMGQALDDLHSLGVDWVRVTAGWSAIAPDPGSSVKPEFDASDPNAYPYGAWHALDRVVLGAAERGMGVNIDIGFWAPRWAVSRPTLPLGRQRWGIDPVAFADFAEAVARRYSGDYRLHDPIDLDPVVRRRAPIRLPQAAAFTIWNEPNEPAFMLPQSRESGSGWTPASPQRYRAMVEAAYPRIKAVSAKSLVLIGGTSSVGDADEGPDRALAPLRFLREMACVDESMRPSTAPGCAGFKPLPGDGWAHHPYSLDLAPSAHDPVADNVRLGDLDRLTSFLDRLHAVGRTQNRLPVYITEYGYQTGPPDPTMPFTPADQADFLPEAEMIAAQNPEVASFAQFLLRDMPIRIGKTSRERWRDYQSGLRFATGLAKPAEQAFRLPFVVQRTAGGIRFWGRVRPASTAVPVRIAARGVDGSWTPVAGLEHLTTDQAGQVSGSAAVDPAGTFRLETAGGGVPEGLVGVATRVTRP